MTAADPGRAGALEAFRREQQKARRKVGPVGSDADRADVLAHALRLAADREAGAEERDGKIRDGVFGYPAAAERLRFARTRDVLARAAPGPDEDAVYLEILARQAASIEVVLRGEVSGTPWHGLGFGDACDRIVLGTLPTVDLDAYAKRHGEWQFVQLASGLVDFVYQMAKATVQCWRATAGPRPGQVSYACDPEDTRRVLQGDDRPYRLFVATLESYLFRGVPRVETERPPPPLHVTALKVLTHFNERFVIGHEYAHTLQDRFDVVHPADQPWAEEFASDGFAFELLVESGGELDGMPPNVSTQGAFFVLTVLDVLREALDLARHGEVREDEGFLGHPPVMERFRALQRIYARDVSSGDGPLAMKAALNPARTLRLLWEGFKGDVAEGRWKGKTPDEGWAGT